MSPDELKKYAEDLQKQFLEVVEALGAMQVTLSAQPQTEPYDYVHQKVAELHRHESYLSDLVVKTNRWKANLDNLVRNKEGYVEVKISEALTTKDEVRKRKSAMDRKAAATVLVAQDLSDLDLLRTLQVDAHQICRSVQRKAVELKSKRIDVHLQYKVMQAERDFSNRYREGSGARESGEASSAKPSQSAPSQDAPSIQGTPLTSQTPTAQDLGITQSQVSQETEDLDPLLSVGSNKAVEHVAETEDLDAILSEVINSNR